MKPFKIDDKSFVEFVRKKHGKFTPDHETIKLFINYVNEYMEHEYKTSAITKKRQFHASRLSKNRRYNNEKVIIQYIKHIESAEPYDLKPKKPYDIETIANKTNMSAQSVRNILKEIAYKCGITLEKGKFKKYIPDIFSNVSKSSIYKMLF